MRFARAILLVLVASGQLRAADDALVPGARVRLYAPDLAAGGIIGRVARVEGDALVIQPERGELPVRVPIRADGRVEVSIGRKSQAGRGAMLGAAIGAAPGLLLTFGDYNDTGDMPSPTVVAIMGAAAGALVGAAVGWAFKAEQWREAELPRASIAIVPLRHGVAASVSVAWRDRR